MTKFTTPFDSYVCEGDSITCEQGYFKFVARIVRDEDANIDDDDCHNVDQSVTGCDDKQQEQLLKCRQAWFDNQWSYCGVVVTAFYNHIKLVEIGSLWGIEANYPDGDNSYLLEVANELLEENFEQAEKLRQELSNKLK